MQALILAGGLGTRLRKVVSNCPKPMVQVGGSPFLEYIILQLKRYNLTEIILSIGYLGDRIREYFQNGRRWGVRIRYSEEKAPLGTGGAIKLAEDLIKTDVFLALNGDSYLDIDLNELIRFHKLQEALATLALVEVSQPDRYGVVEVDGHSRITGFFEKPGKTPSGSVISAGIYLLEAQILTYIPEGRQVSLEEEVFPRLLNDNVPLFGYSSSGYFADIGTPQGYAQIQKDRKHLLR